jgi:hypothetical protein
MHQIFISYRRSDSEDATGRIHDHLGVYFGTEVIFRDIDDIPVGSQFPTELDAALANCKLTIAVIGNQWLDTKDDRGLRRLEDPQDYVRQEIAMALERMPVIPVLVSRAVMPKRDQLPENLRKLASINAVYAPPDQTFRQSILVLAQRIQKLVGIPYEDYWRTLAQCQELGLTMIKEDFRKDDTVLHEIVHSKDLLVVQNDGRSWIDQNRERIFTRFSDKTKTTRVVLYHPKSQFLKTLVEKNGKGIRRQVSEIKGSYKILMSANPPADAISIHGHHGFNPYSLLVSDRYAFVSPYHYHEAGKLPVLKFTVHASEPLYKTLRDDAERLFRQSKPITPQDFSRGL